MKKRNAEARTHGGETGIKAGHRMQGRVWTSVSTILSSSDLTFSVMLTSLPYIIPGRKSSLSRPRIFFLFISWP